MNMKRSYVPFQKIIQYTIICGGLIVMQSLVNECFMVLSFFSRVYKIFEVIFNAILILTTIAGIVFWAWFIKKSGAKRSISVLIGYLIAQGTGIIIYFAFPNNETFRVLFLAQYDGLLWWTIDKWGITLMHKVLPHILMFAVPVFNVLLYICGHFFGGKNKPHRKRQDTQIFEKTPNGSVK